MNIFTELEKQAKQDYRKQPKRNQNQSNAKMGRKKKEGPPSLSIRHHGHEPLPRTWACRGSSPQGTTFASSSSSAVIHFAAAGRGPPAAALDPKARSKSWASVDETSSRRNE